MSEKTRIFVVDDEAVIVGAAAKILSAEGFEVRTAADAESALDLLRGEAPEIALLDLKLPGLSGMELLEILRGKFPETAVIMMTGYSAWDHAVRFLKSGAFDFLPKPFAFEELLSAVQRARRFIALPVAIRQGQAESRSDRYRLGLNSWVKIAAENTALLGITDLFQRTAGEIRQIELPAIGSKLKQGGMLIQIVAQDDLKHTAWSGLSGQVIEVNPLVQDHCDLLSRDPFETGWLVRVVPDNLESELPNLTAEIIRRGA